MLITVLTDSSPVQSTSNIYAGENMLEATPHMHQYVVPMMGVVFS